MTNYTRIQEEYDRRAMDGTIAAADRFHACDSALISQKNGLWVLNEIALPAEDVDFLSTQITNGWARFEKRRLEPFTEFKPAMSAFDANETASPLSAFEQPLKDLREQFPGPANGAGVSLFDVLEGWALSVTKSFFQLKIDTRRLFERSWLKMRFVHIAVPAGCFAAALSLPKALAAGMPAIVMGGAIAILGAAAAAFQYLTAADWARNIKGFEGKFGGMVAQSSLKIGRIYSEQNTLTVQASKDAYQRAGQAFYDTWQAQTPREYPEQQGRWAQIALLKEAEAKAQAVTMDLYSQKVVMAYHGISAYTNYRLNFTERHRSHRWGRGVWCAIEVASYVAALTMIVYAFATAPLPLEKSLWWLGPGLFGLLIGGGFGWKALHGLRERQNKPYAEADFRSAIAGAKPSHTLDASRARLEHLRIEAIRLMREDQKRH